MNPLTLQWVDKAEGDWATLKRESRVRKNPNYDIVCFLAQQCAEKYLKARLQEAAVTFPKTHNLLNLLTLILPIEPAWISLQTALASLTTYGVDYRYPGPFAIKSESQKAVKDCRLVRKTVRQSFGLSTTD